MRRWTGKCLILALLGSFTAAWPTAAWPAQNPGSRPPAAPLAYPGAPKPVYDKVLQPYPMNYADEAVQTLGFRDGHMDVFSTRPMENNPFVPVFSGGLGGNGAMLRLQWRSGR